MTADGRRTEDDLRNSGSTRRAFLKAVSLGSFGIATRRQSPSSFRSPSDSYDFRAIREAILTAIGSHKATGVAVAVAHHGRIVWQEGFGWANRGVGTRVSEHTPFCLASITKPFTTTTLMTLVAAGKVSLNDSANKYLGSRSGLKGNAEGATIRLLGAHAAGLPSMFEMFPSTGDRQSSAALLENYGILAYLPNEVYEYSNIGFAALGAIASSVSGLDFGALLTRQVLRPLGLHDSFFDTDKTRLRNGAVLYDELERPIPEYFTATPPSGELYASVHDLTRFVMFNLKNRLPDQVPILPDHLIDELHKPVFQGPSGATTFGWFRGQTKSGLPVIVKDGGQPGVSTMMYMVPHENLACVALANRSDNGDFIQGLVDQMAGAIVPNWTSPNTSVALPMVDFLGETVYSGKWSGKLRGGGIEMTVSLEIAPSGSATVYLGDKGRPLQITNLRLQGSALVGKSLGTIESADAIRNHATSLSLKLQLRDSKLWGRILASATGPGVLATLPYVVELGRAK